MTATQEIKKAKKEQIHRLSLDLVKLMSLNHNEVSKVLKCKTGTAIKKTLDKQDRFFTEIDLITLLDYSSEKSRLLMLKQREIKNFIIDNQ